MISKLLKIIGLFCKKNQFYGALLQKRPMMLRTLRIGATPYVNSLQSWQFSTTVYILRENQMTFETWNQILFEMRNQVSYENFYFRLSLFLCSIVFDLVYILREINDFWEFLSPSLSLFFFLQSLTEYISYVKSNKFWEFLSPSIIFSFFYSLWRVYTVRANTVFGDSLGPSINPIS